MKEKKEIPVYLFTGFLEAGKTTFIQETLEDPQFNTGEKTLVVLCEEGEVELSPIKFASSNVKIVSLDEEEKFTRESLVALEDTLHFERVVIEYNGMWNLDTLYSNLPDSWTVYQEMMFADSRTFDTYNNNMRNLTVDKMKSAQTIIFKNFTKVMEKMSFHKIVRAINRRCDIIYEYGPDDIEFDDFEDPLPYDMDAAVIEISDKDYAIWYTDINEEEEKYYGKTIKVKGRSLIGGGLKEDEFVIGRHIMTCCVQDIQFGGLVAKYGDSQKLEHGGWVVMTAKVKREYNDMYESEGPVFHVISLEKVDAPEDEVATFY